MNWIAWLMKSHVRRTCGLTSAVCCCSGPSWPRPPAAGSSAAHACVAAAARRARARPRAAWPGAALPPPAGSARRPIHTNIFIHICRANLLHILGIFGHEQLCCGTMVESNLSFYSLTLCSLQCNLQCCRVWSSVLGMDSKILLFTISTIKIQLKCVKFLCILVCFTNTLFLDDFYRKYFYSKKQPKPKTTNTKHFKCPLVKKTCWRF